MTKRDEPRDDTGAHLKSWAESWGTQPPVAEPSDLDALRAELAALYRRLEIVERTLDER